jgi:hypothetical protein
LKKRVKYKTEESQKEKMDFVILIELATLQKKFLDSYKYAQPPQPSSELKKKTNHKLKV